MRALTGRHCVRCGAVVPGAARYCGECSSPLDVPALTVESVDGNLGTPTIDAPEAGGANDVELGGRHQRWPGWMAVAAGVAVLAVAAVMGTSGGAGNSASRPAASEPLASAAPAAATTIASPSNEGAGTSRVSGATEGTATTDGAATTAVASSSSPAALPASVTAETPTYELLAVDGSTGFTAGAGEAERTLEGATLYLLTSGGDLLRVSPQGAVTVLSRGLRNDAALIARQGGVTVTDGDSNRFYRDDGSASRALASGQLFAGPEPDQVWAVSWDTDVRAASIQRVTDGQTLVTVAMPDRALPVGDDGQGRLLVMVEGAGTYRVDAAGAATLRTRAAVLDATAAALLVYECDDAMVCGHYLFDPATGMSEPLAFDLPPGGGLAQLDTNATCVAFVDWSSATLFLSDVPGGTPAALGSIDAGQNWQGGPLQWSGDGGRLLWLHHGEVNVWTRETGAVATLFLGTHHQVPVNAFAMAL